MPERMLPELEHLITLQRIENRAAAARARLDRIPALAENLDARIGESAAEVAGAERRHDDLKTDRNALEKELAMVQARLSRFRDQLMAVKTNKEYQAMQAEITSAEAAVGRLEDRILERMLEADELTAEIRRAEQRLAEARAAVEAERAELERERGDLRKEIERLDAERTAQIGVLAPRSLSLFRTVAEHRNGIAVVEARDGRCSSCQVRLRPQLFNHVRLNESVTQCESCQRILYFDAGSGGAAAEPASG